MRFPGSHPLGNVVQGIRWHKRPLEFLSGFQTRGPVLLGPQGKWGSWVQRVPDERQFGDHAIVDKVIIAPDCWPGIKIGLFLGEKQIPHRADSVPGVFFFDNLMNSFVYSRPYTGNAVRQVACSDTMAGLIGRPGGSNDCRRPIRQRGTGHWPQNNGYAAGAVDHRGYQWDRKDGDNG